MRYLYIKRRDENVGMHVIYLKSMVLWKYWLAMACDIMMAPQHKHMKINHVIAHHKDKIIKE
jgi:hypothetical protein